jgi:hypothetical protein
VTLITFLLSSSSGRGAPVLMWLFAMCCDTALAITYMLTKASVP